MSLCLSYLEFLQLMENIASLLKSNLIHFDNALYFLLSPHALWEKQYVFTESHDKYTSICASVNLVHVLLFNSSCNLYYSTFKFIEFFTIVQICHWGILIEHFISFYESYFQNFHLVLSCISIFLPILYRMSHFHLSPH
jgi:hypothetical protein